jgi:AGZA family xanthine/uracil permease-like MFS transporter
MMMRGVLAINWNYPGDSIPAFVTLMFMPFSYSIAYGLIAGIMCYAIINTTTWALGAISGGRLLPPDYDNKEYWSCECCLNPSYMNVTNKLIVRSDSPRAQPWFIRAFKGDKQFWRPQDTDSFELESTETHTPKA